VFRKLEPAPPPLEANDQLVIGVITAGWAVALAVMLVLRDQLRPADRWWIWICAAGVGLGVFGLWYTPRVKRARARGAARRDETRPGAAQPWSSDSKTVSSTETPGRSTRS
jgi:type VI protein secretion system component VasK